MDTTGEIIEPASSTSNVTDPAGSNGIYEGSQTVKVAVHIRPLIGTEVFQGCKDCVSVVPGEPQVQIGNHSFTFDHVYGSTGSPSAAIFEECVSPLVEGLFHGYNATVLAYGQTGSGKTYTMGTGYTVGGSAEGIIPQVMDMIFSKVSELKEKSEFQIRASFIEILKEEVHDLLDPNPSMAAKTEMPNGSGPKAAAPGKAPIQIRENTNGEITLAGVTEVDVNSLNEMAACLEQGSLCRATASTNMNSRSSRSHAIFTIALEQKRRMDVAAIRCANVMDDGSDDFLCAKLHLVDLAGSERAKRTGADGARFKEGVHINKGLLALGNVISALGDDKKRKEGGHVPYRDSKLTRLLQDSLGGNSRTVMIACISPADSNAEETLNTLKYANRARNIQNKPIVNRDPMAAEMQRMRQQVELLQAELLCIQEGGFFEEIQILKRKTVCLEASLMELQQELKVARDNLQRGTQRILEAEVARDKLLLKLDMLRSGKTLEELDGASESQGKGLLESYAARIKVLETEVQQLRSVGCQTLVYVQPILSSTMSNLYIPEEVEKADVEEETIAKELEHERVQNSLDKELQELNQKLEQKEAEMKTFIRSDGFVLKHHFEKKIIELEKEKQHLQIERDSLLAELATLSNASDEHSHKLQGTYQQKIKALEMQIAELKRKQENQSLLLKEKQRSDEAAKRLQEEIQRIKTQKVQLQHKIKQESEQFRLWKASREKEVMQLKKEGRRNEYEMHKLQALNQRQKMVLQRKTEEAAMATRRLKELLEARRPPKENGASAVNGSSAQVNNAKGLEQWVDHELEVAVHIHEVRSNYDKQTDSRIALAKELAKLRHEQDSSNNQVVGAAVNSAVMLSPGARHAKIALLESMLNASSSTLVAMASQLSEAEERERSFSGHARWQHLRSMVDVKNLLQYVFSSAADARCGYWDKELENKELRERILELTGLLKQGEAHRQERERQQFAKDQHVANELASALKVGTSAAMKSCISKQYLQLADVAPKQLEFPGKLDVDDSVDENSELCHDSQKASQSCISRDIEVTEGSEEESDMDMDIDIDNDIDVDGSSDEDWSEQGEKRTFGKHRLHRVKSNKLQQEQQVSEIGENAEGGLQPITQLCCSCSKSSGCKTNKCECKAAGSLCDLTCGCSIRKCANRGAEVTETEALEVAEAMETYKRDKELKQADKQSTSKYTGDAILKKEDVSRAEQVLARHGASVLKDVWNEELHIGLIQAVKAIDEGNHKIAFRRPLQDINNITVKQAEAQQPKQRKRWAKALVQLVPSVASTPPQSTTTQPVDCSKLSETEQHHQSTDTTLEAATMISGQAAATLHAGVELSRDDVMQHVPSSAHCVVPNEPREDRHPPGKLSLRNTRKKFSPPSSPLRARNNSTVGDESAGLSRRLGYPGNSTITASPRGAGKGVAQEKENV